MSTAASGIISQELLVSEIVSSLSCYSGYDVVSHSTGEVSIYFKCLDNVLLRFLLPIFFRHNINYWIKCSKSKPGYIHLHAFN